MMFDSNTNFIKVRLGSFSYQQMFKTILQWNQNIIWQIKSGVNVAVDFRSVFLEDTLMPCK